jgi:predicted methyltransferase
MRQPLFRIFLAAAIALSSVAACAAEPEQAPPAANQAIQAAVAASTRTPANVQRDRYRHPVETLGFFGVEPDQTIVEVWPAGGWYTEILAPLVRKRGTYWGVGSDRMVGRIKEMASAKPDLYGHIKIAAFPADTGNAKVPDGTADVVLTFRNVHNWMMGDKPFAEEAFRQMFAMLKPGGVLGVVDHRLPEGASSDRERNSGYLKVSTVRRLAESAGFQFAGASEVNANPKDTADWPNGVWTLPPSLDGDPADREKFLAIGESDRMTLKFVKPE